MQKLFPGYYRPASVRDLWKDCIFTLDANVLLHIYRYSPDTREQFFKVLEVLQNRLWIAHQAAYEFQRNRLTVITKQYDAYDQVSDLLIKNVSQLESTLGTYSVHQAIHTQSIIERLRNFVRELQVEISTAKSKHEILIHEDLLRERLDTLLNGKVGSPFTKDVLKGIYKDAEERFKIKIPPGYEDAKNKTPPDSYGDVVFWYQLKEHAKTQQKPLILVTDDKKDDWWLRHKGEIIGPRPELVQEMAEFAGVQFYMYRFRQFLQYAEETFNLQLQRAIDEVLELERKYQSLEERREMLESLADSVMEEYVPGADITSLSDPVREAYRAGLQLRVDAESYEVFNATSEKPQMISDISKAISKDVDSVRSIILKLAQQHLIKLIPVRIGQGNLPHIILTNFGRLVQKITPMIPQDNVDEYLDYLADSWK